MLPPLDAAARARLESEILPRLLPAARWYRAKSRPLARVEVAREVALGDAARLLWVRCSYTDGGLNETYLFPASPDAASEASADSALHAGLLRLVLAGESLPGSDGGQLAGRAGQRAPAMADGASRLLGLEQSNTSILFDQPGRRLFLKLYRQVAAGKNPDAELIAHLSERAGFTAVPAYVGALEYEPADGSAAESVGLLQEFVGGRRDAWEVFVERARAHVSGRSDFDPGPTELARRLGELTAQMHAALAAHWNDPALDATALDAPDFDRLRGRLEESLGRIERAAQQPHRLPRLAEHVVRVNLTAEWFRKVRATHARRLAQAAGHRLPKTRVHGDFHLGQILLGDAGDAVFLDFEGEPARPAEERRQRQSPLFDVAGMLRSFDYAGQVAVEFRGDTIPEPTSPLFAASNRAASWTRHCEEFFLPAYLRVATAAGLMGEGNGWRALLDALTLEKACYELAYELDNRPDWAPIPLAGIGPLLAEPLS